MRKKILIFTFSFIVVSIITVYFCNNKIEQTSNGKLFSNVDSIPYNKVGLLLGTGKFLKHESLNPFYTNRIDAAAELMKAGKIKYLIISGDNSTKDYDEPTSMKADLVAAGIDSNYIFLDYAGFRTFDSVIRAKEIFGQHELTIISQQFHNQRALFIASNENINAIGYNAKDVGKHFGFMTNVREKLARVKVFIDYMTGKSPHFLGEKIVIPD